LSFAFLLLVSVVASARIASAAPPAPTPAVDWTGFYVGGNFGYGIGQARASTGGFLPNFSRTVPDGMVGGGQAGYRFQYNWLVVGAETDFQWSGQNDALCYYGPTVGCRPVFGTFSSSRLDWFGTVRAVAGVAQDNSLWYVTGGYAYGKVETQTGGFALGGGQSAASSDRVTQHGWTVGAGVETRLPASNWSVKLEYLYVDLGHQTVQPQCAGTDDASGFRLGCDSPPAGVAPSGTISFKDHVARIGLNYAFGGTRPAASAVAPRPAMTPANWTGFYVGGNAGYVAGDDSLEIQRIAPNGSLTSKGRFSDPLSPSGFMGGVQAGYRFQRNWLVVGAEADYQWSAQNDTTCAPCTSSPINADAKRNRLGTVRGVAGVAYGDWLWYVTGGYAYGRVAIDQNQELAFNPPIVASYDSTRSGWTAGVGVETRLRASNWSVKLEYLYVDLGNALFDGNCPARTGSAFGLPSGRCEAVDYSITDHVFRVGLNYRFGH
jgi:outer membrane immunogenic protein